MTTLTRSSNDWISPAALRVLLKNNLGLNARKVTVREGHSRQYLTITIRDASVDRNAVKAFASTFSTWHMDNTDYVTGQSISVETTREVDAIHAAPYIEEIKAAMEKVEMGSGIKVSNGAFFWLTSQGFYFSRDLKRTPYVSEPDARRGAEWALRALGLNMSQI